MRYRFISENHKQEFIAKGDEIENKDGVIENTNQLVVDEIDKEGLDTFYLTLVEENHYKVMNNDGNIVGDMYYHFRTDEIENYLAIV